MRVFGRVCLCSCFCVFLGSCECVYVCFCVCAFVFVCTCLFMSVFQLVLYGSLWLLALCFGFAIATSLSLRLPECSRLFGHFLLRCFAPCRFPTNDNRDFVKFDRQEKNPR